MAEYPTRGFKDEDLTNLIPRLRRLAHYYAGNKLDSLELLDRTTAQAVTKRDLYSSEKGKLIAWLTVMMRNLWFRELRIRQSEKKLYDALERKAEASAFSNSQVARPQPLAALVLKEVMKGIERLPPETGEAILLITEGATLKEIAALQNVPLGTVKSRISRGRDELRKLLPAEFL